MGKKNTVEDFWKYVDRSDGCWNWTGGTDYDGYGQWWFDEKNIRAHRFSLTISGVEIGPGQVVKHNCHNPSCVRPSHLQAASQKENIADQLKRGTHSRLKYSDSLVQSIIDDHKNLGLGARKLSQKYGVSSSQVGLIISNKSRKIRKEKIESAV